VEKFGTSFTGIVQLTIRVRCFRKHKLKDPKGKEEEEEEETLPCRLEKIIIENSTRPKSLFVLRYIQNTSI
jgi:hypothetical protein